MTGKESHVVDIVTPAGVVGSAEPDCHIIRSNDRKRFVLELLVSDVFTPIAEEDNTGYVPSDALSTLAEEVKDLVAHQKATVDPEVPLELDLSVLEDRDGVRIIRGQHV